MLVFVYILLLVTVGFCVLYLFVLSVLALFGKTSRPASTRHHHRFAAIIPAHNEEQTIAPTIKSLLQTEYPRQKVDVIVVADNCADRTAAVGQENGATVLERTDETLRGKGHALRWCFDRLLPQGRYDAFVVVDADSVVSPNFFSVMDEYLQRNATVIQASDLVKPRHDSWSSEMTRVGFLLYNYVRPLGRRVLGCSAGLRGNGMCLAAEVLRKHPWEAYSRAEDLEFGLSLLLKGVRVYFAPEARVLATMPHDPRLAESQRARWEGGRLPVIERFAWRLLSNALTRGSFRLLDAFIDLVTPPLVMLMAIVVTILLATIVLATVGLIPEMFVYLWGAVLLLGILHMFIGLLAAKADASLYRALLYIPRYALWKAALMLKLVKQDKTTEWIRTTREPAVAQGNSTKR
jgi:cellulose synthase/poly-beta-1,6-N-acetylglucosamine synthase-like glycosyltransferase